MENVTWTWPGISTCGNGQNLNINEACLEIASDSINTLQFSSQSVECHNCPLLVQGDVTSRNVSAFIIDTNYPLRLHLNGSEPCDQSYWFEDFGLYRWNVTNDGCSEIIIQETPEYFWLNMGTVFAVLSVSLLIYKFVFCMHLKRLATRGSVPFQELQANSPNDTPTRRTERSERVRNRQRTRVASIDLFRGLAVALMIFVNYGGGQYSVFKHAPWNGLTLADIVFPFFIWIMGASSVISLRSQLRASTDRSAIFWKIFRRSVILISMGVILNSGKSSEKALRIPGVLQRIGLTYFTISIIELTFGKPQRSNMFGPWNILVEVFDAALQWLVAFTLIGAQLLITFLLPVPGCPTGYLGPGGLPEDSANFNCTGGAAGYIDRLVFTKEHIYQWPTCRKLYQTTLPYDPEGLLGSINSVVLAMLGVHCGRILLSHENGRSRIIRFLLSGVVTGIIAGSLCSWSQNYGVIPVNKNLWSLSYVLATASMAFVLFAFLYWLVDHKKIWSGPPFVYAGMNAIVLYLGHEILNKQLPWRWHPFTSTHLELLIMDVFASSAWLVIAYILHLNNIFVSL